VKRLVAIVWIAAAGFAQQNPKPSKKAAVLNDPKQILNTALGLARSPDAAGHKQLQSQLIDPNYLSSLDSDAEYRQTGMRLRIAKVLQALGGNPAPSAAAMLLHLAGNEQFLAEPVRVDFLIRYSSGIRPAPPQLVAFWDKHSQPEDGFTPLTIEALTTNGSEPALALLEKKLADPSHPDDDKQFWMRSYMLPHRNEAPLLRTVERLLTKTLADRLKPDLVEAMFDYQPDQWYSEHTIVKQPDRRLATPEAQSLMRRIGLMSLKDIPLTAAQQAAVKRSLVQIGPG
jgi:hypothetical protein